MSDDTFRASEILKVLFSQFDTTSMQEASSILTSWKEILSKSCVDVRNSGRKIADHSRVVDLKNNILQVEADHPGWIQMLTMHQSSILKEIKKKFPDLEIKGISFRLTK